jgi:peptidyl-prolyl cis-trans isomerase SurA
MLFLLSLLCASVSMVSAQESPSATEGTDSTAAASTEKPLLLDRVIAIVNRDILLESDLDAEMRFAAFQPLSTGGGDDPRLEAMARLIDRTLVAQQMKLRGNPPVITDTQVTTQLTQLRQSLPECSKYDCTTDAGWEKFCADHGFTSVLIQERWRLRMQLLAFVEQRFRAGVRISNPEIEQYYKEKFVPRFAEKKLTPPALEKVSDRIQEILLQEKVNLLLDGWLSSLHEQGSIKVLDPSLLSASGDTNSSM